MENDNNNDLRLLHDYAEDPLLQGLYEYVGNFGIPLPQQHDLARADEIRGEESYMSLEDLGVQDEEMDDNSWEDLDSEVIIPDLVRLLSQDTGFYQQLDSYLSMVEEVKDALTEDEILKHVETRTYVAFPREHGEMCVICQLDYEDKETIGILRCGHNYHVECIKKWLLRNNVCPLCKRTAFDK